MRRARRLKFSANHPLNPELDHHIKHFDVNGITDDMDIVYTTVGNFFLVGGVSAMSPIKLLVNFSGPNSSSASASIRSQHSLGSYLIVVVAATLSDMTQSHFDLQDL